MKIHSFFGQVNGSNTLVRDAIRQIQAVNPSAVDPTILNAEEVRLSLNSVGDSHDITLSLPDGAYTLVTVPKDETKPVYLAAALPTDHRGLFGEFYHADGRVTKADEKTVIKLGRVIDHKTLAALPEKALAQLGNLLG